MEGTHAARAALDALGLHVAREVVRLETWIDEVLDATLRPDKADQFAALTRLNREVWAFTISFLLPKASAFTFSFLERIYHSETHIPFAL